MTLQLHNNKIYDIFLLDENTNNMETHDTSTDLNVIDNIERLSLSTTDLNIVSQLSPPATPPQQSDMEGPSELSNTHIIDNDTNQPTSSPNDCDTRRKRKRVTEGLCNRLIVNGYYIFNSNLQVLFIDDLDESPKQDKRRSTGGIQGQ